MANTRYHDTPPSFSSTSCSRSAPWKSQHVPHYHHSRQLQKFMTLSEPHPLTLHGHFHQDSSNNNREELLRRRYHDARCHNHQQQHKHCTPDSWSNAHVLFRWMRLWKREGVLNLAAVPRLLQNCRNARGPSKLNMPKQPWLPKECCPVRAHLAVVQGMMGKQNICQQHLHRSNCRIASRVQSLQAWTTEQGHCPRTSGRHQGWATPMYISPDFSMNRTGAP